MENEVLQAVVWIWPHVFRFIGMVAGMGLHFLTEIKRLRDEGKIVSIREYWSDNPIQTWIAVIGGMIGYMLLADQGEDNVFYFIMYGYICDEIPKLLGDRANKNFRNRKIK